VRELRAVDQQLSRYTGDHTIDQIAQAGVKFRLAEVHRSAAKPYLPTWYKKTTGGTLTTTRNVSLDGWVPATAGCDKEKLAPYATSTVRDTTPQARYTWAIPPWLRPPTDDTDAPALRKMLGATTTGTHAESDRPIRGPPLRPDATITTPWRHAPLIPHPHDAVDLAYWYRSSAHAQGWHPDDNPVPFWLPNSARCHDPPPEHAAPATRNPTTASDRRRTRSRGQRSNTRRTGPSLDQQLARHRG